MCDDNLNRLRSVETSRRTKNNMASSSENTPWLGMQSLGLHLKKEENYLTFFKST